MPCRPRQVLVLLRGVLLHERLRRMPCRPRQVLVLLRGVLLMCVRVVLRVVVVLVVVLLQQLRRLRPTRRRRHLQLFGMGAMRPGHLLLFRMGALQPGRKAPAVGHHPRQDQLCGCEEGVKYRFKPWPGQANTDANVPCSSNHNSSQLFRNYCENERGTLSRCSDIRARQQMATRLSAAK